MSEEPLQKKTRVETASAEETIGMSFSCVRSLMESEGRLPVHASWPPIRASLKTLFSDFVVREQTMLVDNGKPLRLTELSLPKPATSSSAAAEEDTDMEPPVRAAFKDLLSISDLDGLIAFLKEATPSYTLQPIAEKATRSAIHAAVKKVFGTSYVSSSDNGRLVIQRATKALLTQQARRTKKTCDEEYTHFTLYKENLDSGSALRMIAQQVGISAKSLMFSGTKDKRGVTLQRVAVKGVEPSRLLKLNAGRFGRNGTLKIGNLEQCSNGLSLGDLAGNTFEVVLRVVDSGIVETDDSSVEHQVTQISNVMDGVQTALRRVGFVNYFGPQRFGTTSILTSDVGIALLRGNFREAAQLVVSSKCDVSPETMPAYELMANGQFEAALEACPHYCYLERDILKQLIRSNGDYRSTFDCVPRTTAMLYFHAVQSLLWNRMASARLQSQGVHPVVGDLVAVRADGAALDTTLNAMDGEEGCEAPLESSAQDTNNAVGSSKLIAVRTLTEADIASGKYTLRDVLLTVPGPDTDLEFPTCPSADRQGYVRVLQELGCEELMTDRMNLARTFHFHGTYRKLTIVPADFSWELRPIHFFREPVLKTDLEVLISAKKNRGDKKGQGDTSSNTITATGGASVPNSDAPPIAAEEEEKDDEPNPPCSVDASATVPKVPLPAIIVRFGLPPGTYATSLIREFCTATRD